MKKVNSKFLRLIVGILLCLAVISFVGACKKSDAGGAGQRITLYNAGWADMGELFSPMLPSFQQTHPNVDFEYVQTTFLPHHQALQTSLAAGSGANDVEQIETAWIASFRDSTALEDMLAPPYNAGQWKDKHINFKWTQGLSTDRTRMIAMPWDMGPLGFFYRADVFEEVGLPTEPEDVAEFMSTWEGFVEVARRVYKPNERWLIHDVSEVYNMLFRKRDYFDEQLNFRIDRRNDIACLNACLEIRRNGWDMQSTGNEATAARTSGAVISEITASWGVGTYVRDRLDQSGKWRITTLPDRHPSSNAGGSFLAIPSQGKNKQIAYEWIEHVLCTVESGVNQYVLRGFWPTFIPAWSDAAFLEPHPYFGGQKIGEMFGKIALELDQPIFMTIMDGNADSLMLTTINEGLNRNLTPQQIKDTLKDAVEAATAEQKRQQIDIFHSIGFGNF